MADADDDQGGGSADPRLDALCQYTLRTLKVCVCVCVCVYVFVSVCAHVRTCTCVCFCVHVCMCAYLFMPVLNVCWS